MVDAGMLARQSLGRCAAGSPDTQNAGGAFNGSRIFRFGRPSLSHWFEVSHPMLGFRPQNL
jgi:hypothetical protein